MATIVLAHGAWSAAWAWKKMRPLMAAAGHAFFTPSYTGLGERAHLATPENDLDSHIEDVLGVLTFEDLRNVVLLGHSYGGMVATGVADRAGERIAQIVYLDAFVPQDGEALADFWSAAERQRRMEALAAGDGWRIAPNPIPSDTSAEDAAWVAKFRMPQSVKCFEQPLRLRNKLTMPCSYIQCMRYAERGPFGQFAARARAAGWPTYELDASHSPNVTAPDALMALLQRTLLISGSKRPPYRSRRGVITVAKVATGGYHTTMPTVPIKEAKDRLTALARLVEKGETVVVTRNGEPAFDMVPHRASTLRLQAGVEFLERRGVKEIFPYVADDFDAPLAEDVLLRPLPKLP